MRRSAFPWPPIVLAVVGLALLTFVFHGETLRGWWMDDDPQLLIQAMRETPRTTLFSPERWRQYSSSNFTPLVVLAYEIDFHLSGLNPGVFYAHNLLVSWIAAVLLFLYLRRWVGDRWALATAAVFLAGPVMTNLARTLNARHYIEGLCWSLLALIFWERRSRSGAMLTGVFYFLACLSKEIYAPLPLLLLARSIVRRDSLRQITSLMFPSALSAVAYVVWRQWMLGSAGGYGAALPPATLVSLPTELWLLATAASPWWIAMLWSLAFTALLAVSLLRKHWPVSALLLVAVFATLPLLPIVENPLMRYGFLPSILASCSLALLAAPLSRPWKLVAAVGLVSVVVVGTYQRLASNQRNRRMVAEGRYVFSAAPDATPLLAGSHNSYVDGMRFLRLHLGRGAAPAAYMSLYGPAIEGVREVFQVQSGATTKGNIRSLVENMVPPPPMSVRVERKGNDLRWSLDGEGSWYILPLPGYEMRPIRAQARWRFPRDAFPPSSFLAPPYAAFRVLLIQPGGRWSVTPPLSFPADGEIVRWESR